MSGASADIRSVIVEREIAHPPEKIWRALTQPHLIEEWLMKTDFKPALGHRFGFRAEWGDVGCEIVEIEPNRTLSYTWAGKDLDSIVTWTLFPTPAGTRLRMEQAGFRPDQKLAYHGARAGWPRFLARLEQVLARMD
ncbi:SRPBCC domain-containing protein [Sphingomonas gilva]|uniref:SRPBCC domain-containing protein n=1 Tax=Sphingomonas gilva TaxID=2305907 RepID=A0A396RMA1_9SPHN|nr:SRPBCC domain-containing protein [Sphingomonas gilva]RHW17488.1 SRPBCC domain-containing protein [Sphingomonas gilva]